MERECMAKQIWNFDRFKRGNFLNRPGRLNFFFDDKGNSGTDFSKYKTLLNNEFQRIVCWHSTLLSCCHGYSEWSPEPLVCRMWKFNSSRPPEMRTKKEFQTWTNKRNWIIFLFSFFFPLRHWLGTQFKIKWHSQSVRSFYGQEITRGHTHTHNCTGRDCTPDYVRIWLGRLLLVDP